MRNAIVMYDSLDFHYKSVTMRASRYRETVFANKDGKRIGRIRDKGGREGVGSERIKRRNRELGGAL